MTHAKAIFEAASRPTMRFVPVKTLAQQDLQALHRIRERLVVQRTALINQTRGLLAEYGIVLPKGPGRATLGQRSVGRTTRLDGHTVLYPQMAD